MESKQLTKLNRNETKLKSVPIKLIYEKERVKVVKECMYGGSNERSFFIATPRNGLFYLKLLYYIHGNHVNF